MKYNIEETDQFLEDVEEAAVWILLSNIEQSESLAESNVEQFGTEVNALKGDFRNSPNPEKLGIR